jgi:hypothetical protein
VPDIGPKIRLMAAASGDYAVMTLADGKKTHSTAPVKVSHVAAGKVGLWLFQIVWSDKYRAPQLPSPQDWVPVLERVKP